MDGALNGAGGDLVDEVPGLAPVSEGFFITPDEGDVFRFDNDFAVGVEIGENLGFKVWAAGWVHVKTGCLLGLELIFYRCIFCRELVGFCPYVVCDKTTCVLRYLADDDNHHKGLCSQRLDFLLRCTFCIELREDKGVLFFFLAPTFFVAWPCLAGGRPMSSLANLGGVEVAGSE